MKPGEEKGKNANRNEKGSSVVSGKRGIQESWNYKSSEVKRTYTAQSLILTLIFVISPGTINPRAGLGCRRTVSPFSLLAMHCPQRWYRPRPAAESAEPCHEWRAVPPGTAQRGLGSTPVTQLPTEPSRPVSLSPFCRS